MKRIILALLTFWIAGTPWAIAQEPNRFRVNFGTADVQLDPASGQTALEAQLLTALYEGLVSYDPLSLRPVPGAARAWEFSADGLTLTFTLRPNLHFQDGSPLTSQDFRDSWLRILTPGSGAPFASLLDGIRGAQAWREGKLTDLAELGIRTPDPSTLVLELTEPAPHLLSILCHYAFVPVDATFRHQGRPEGPLANGPFQIQSRQAHQWTLIKNPQYWDQANVKLDTLEVSFRDDAAAVTRAFKEGDYDWVADGIDGNTSLNARLVSANALFGTSFFYFRSDKAPWNDVRVRQALIQLLPLEELRKPYLQPTNVLIPRFEGYPEVKGLVAADKTAALQLLTAAGFPDGRGLPPLTLALPEGSQNQTFIDFFTSAWKEIGLEVKFLPVNGNYYDQLASLDYTMGYFSWIGDFLDPITFLVLWKGGSSLNSFGFTDANYDQLLAQAARQTGTDRFKTLGQAEELLLQGGLLIPLSHTPGFSLIDRDLVGGWYPNPLDIHPFKNLYLKPPKPPKNSVRFDLW